MAFRGHEKRRGRVILWVCGGLLGLFVCLVVYQKFFQTPWQKQKDEEVDGLNKADLEGVKLSEADPHDWPQWRGVHRDARAPGDGLITDWPAGGPPRAWKIKGGGGFSAISVVGKRLVTMIQDGDNEVVVCWEDQGEQAKELWRFAYPNKFTQDGTGPRATPTIHDGLVYTLGPSGHLFCLKLEDGKEVWKKRLTETFTTSVPRWGFSSSPLVEGDLLLITPGGDGNAVAALDRKTGEVKWKALSGHPGYSSPVISTGGGVRQALFFLGNELVGLEPKTGEVFWRFPWETQHQVNAATPIVVKDRATGSDFVFLSSGYGKGCGMVRVFKGGNGKPAVEEVYTNNLMHNHFGTCVYVDDYLYGFNEGYLVCMKFRMDKRKAVKVEWKERGYNKGSLLAVGKHLIVLSDSGQLGLVEANPSQYVEKAKFTLTKGLCWTMPVVAHGRLYVRDEHDVHCFDLRAK
jgi:outer membrane protein assembly factor BamB